MALGCMWTDGNWHLVRSFFKKRSALIFPCFCWVLSVKMSKRCCGFKYYKVKKECFILKVPTWCGCACRHGWGGQPVFSWAVIDIVNFEISQEKNNDWGHLCITCASSSNITCSCCLWPFDLVSIRAGISQLLTNCQRRLWQRLLPHFVVAFFLGPILNPS